jgi:hypothetical protein
MAALAGAQWESIKDLFADHRPLFSALRDSSLMKCLGARTRAALEARSP